MLAVLLGSHLASFEFSTCGDVKNFFKSSSATTQGKSCCGAGDEILLAQVSTGTAWQSLKRGGVIQVGMTSAPTSKPLPFLMRKDVYSSSTRPRQGWSLLTLAPAPSFKVLPVVAKDSVVPTTTITDNGVTKYVKTVPLVRGMKWSDGNEFVCSDFKFTYDTQKSMKANNKTNMDDSLLVNGKLTNIQCQDDDHTIVMTFSEVPGLSMWYSVGLVEVFQKTFWETKVGTLSKESSLDVLQGMPTAFEEKINLDHTYWPTRIVWTANEAHPNNQDAAKASYRVCADGGVTIVGGPSRDTYAYYGGCAESDSSSTLLRPGPYWEHIVITVYSGRSELQDAIDTGLVNAQFIPTGPDLAYPKTLPSTRASGRGAGTRYISMNTRVYPGSSRAFRRAVACMLPIDDINRQFSLLSNPMMTTSTNIATVDLPSSGGIFDVCKDMDESERLAHAKSMLVAEGWNMESRPILTPSGNASAPITFIVSDIEYDSVRTAYAYFASDYLRKLGFVVHVEVDTFPNVLKKTIEIPVCNQWQMMIGGWGDDSRPGFADLLTLFEDAEDTCVKDRGNNHVGFANAEYAQALQSYKTALTVEDIKNHSVTMQNILYEEVPYVNLFAFQKESRYSYVEFPNSYYGDAYDGLMLLGIPGGSHNKNYVFAKRAPGGEVNLTRILTYTPPETGCADNADYRFMPQYNGGFTCAETAANAKGAGGSCYNLPAAWSATTEERLGLIQNCKSSCGDNSEYRLFDVEAYSCTVFANNAESNCYNMVNLGWGVDDARMREAVFNCPISCGKDDPNFKYMPEYNGGFSCAQVGVNRGENTCLQANTGWGGTAEMGNELVFRCPEACCDN